MKLCPHFSPADITLLTLVNMEDMGSPVQRFGKSNSPSYLGKNGQVLRIHPNMLRGHMNHVTRKDTIFKLLDQNGPFATMENITQAGVFSNLSRGQVQELKKHNLFNRYRSTRNLILEVLDIQSLEEIRPLINDHERRQAASQRAFFLLSRMFGIAGSENECRIAIKNYSRTADGVIRYLKRAVLSPYESYLDMDNKVDAIDDPVELLLIPFDDRYHKKSRFEAKRKLILMQLAAAIEQREKETKIEEKFALFLDFLNNHVWSADVKFGEQEPAILLSRHSPEDFSCCEVSVHAWNMIQEAGIDPPLEFGRKKTLIKHLWFHTDNQRIPIYVIVRKKEPVAKVLKLLRKGEENPDVAVADELGLMGVTEGIPEVRIFQRHLTECAVRAGSFLTQEDISDTLEGSSYNGNIGSSGKTPMLKFFARMGGMRVEFIIHTYKSFLNYIYKRGVAHREYEVNRLYDSGVLDLLFPKDIYFLDLELIKDELLLRFRKEIEAV